jgi:hypothetical protein
MKAHEWFIEHRVDYATRTLDLEDAKTFAAHLGACEECQREVTSIESDLKWLPMALPPVPPRPGLHRRIIEGVLEDPKRRGQPWRLAGALAASTLLAAAGWYLSGARASALQRELERQGAVVAALQDTLSIMRRAGRILQANVEVGDARGGLLIFADEVTHRWNVVVHGLPPAPGGHRYQFWFICADTMVRGAEVAADTLRPTMFTTGMPQPQSCPAVKGAALTVEPIADGQGPPQGKSLAHLML